MPNQPKTPTRTIRVRTSLWDDAKAKAYAEGRTITDVIVRALENYTEREH